MLPVYWINLDVSRDRRLRLLLELERAKITSHYRVPAVCPDDLSLYDINDCSEAAVLFQQNGAAPSRISRQYGQLGVTNRR